MSTQRKVSWRCVFAKNITYIIFIMGKQEKEGVKWLPKISTDALL